MLFKNGDNEKEILNRPGSSSSGNIVWALTVRKLMKPNKKTRYITQHVFFLSKSTAQNIKDKRNNPSQASSDLSLCFSSEKSPQRTSKRKLTGAVIVFDVRTNRSSQKPHSHTEPKHYWRRAFCRGTRGNTESENSEPDRRKATRLWSHLKKF